MKTKFKKAITNWLAISEVAVLKPNQPCDDSSRASSIAKVIKPTKKFAKFYYSQHFKNVAYKLQLVNLRPRLSLHPPARLEDPPANDHEDEADEASRHGADHYIRIGMAGKAIAKAIN